MKIAIGRHTFVRCIKSDVLFCNPISGASVVLQNGDRFAKTLSKQYKSTDDVFIDLAEDCELQEDIVRRDFGPLIDMLMDEGLIVAQHDKITDDQGRILPEFVHMGTSTKVIGEGDPVGNFYKERGALLALHIDITSCCTERCVHCYLPDYPVRHLDYRYIEKVLNDFRRMEGLTVYISGGECMAHPDFERIISKCRSLDLNIVILSNLTLCDRAKIELLKEISPQYINVSLYSMSPAEHDVITTIPGSWKKTMDAILALQREGLNVRLAAPLLKANRHAFQELQKFADKHNMHLVTDFSIIAKCNHDLSNLQYACSSEELEDTLRANKEIFDMGWAKSKSCIDDPESTLCDIGVFRVHLNSKGDFYPCPSMYGYVLGNVRDSSIEEIWKCKKLQRLRDVRLKHLERCLHCAHRAFCEPCIAYNFNATGDLFKVAPEKCQMAIVVHKVYGE